MSTTTATQSESELIKQLAEVSANLPKFHKKAQDRIDSAISKLIAFKPIFGTVFLFLNKIQDRGMPTMAVGVIRRVDLGLFYNPEFVMKLTHNELKAVLIHESLHILLHHITRSEHFGMNRKGYNIAADMAINCHIPSLPENCFYPKTYSLPDFESAEWYYDQLKQEAEKQNKELNNIGDGKGELADSHDKWGECEDDVVKEKVRGIARSAIKAQEEKGWSDVGSGIAQSIIEANKPVVNWKRELRYFINQVVLAGRKSTRSRLNRREHSTRTRREGFLKNVYLQPGVKRDFKSRLLVAVDTSGSMSDAELKICLSEINGMATHVECHVMMFDTEIQGEPVEIKKRLSSFQIKGRGGTNFDPVMRYAESHRYDGLIVLTDGFAPFSEPPKGVRVMWGLTPSGESVTPPYGKRVVIKINKDK